MNKNYDLSMGARRLQNVPKSPIRKINELLAELVAEGHDVISFGQGEPDFDTPETIKKATIKAIEENYTRYDETKGNAEFLQAVSDYIYEDTGARYNPDTEIVITTGGSEAMNNVLFAFLDEGDEAIVLSPAYVAYKALVNLCQAKYVEVPLDASKDFDVNIDAVKNAITDKTKMIIINNPSNPTGEVYSRESLEALCKLAVENNILIVSDEMYSKFLYDGEKFVSAAAFPEARDNVIIINGCSKTYAMTGWRVGFTCASEALTQRILRVHQNTANCQPTFIMVGLANSMNTKETMAEVGKMLDAYAKRRQLIKDLIADIPGLSSNNPKGAFYIMLDVSGLGMTGEEFSEKLLREKYVATVPAMGFGSGVDQYVRIAYCKSEEEIRKGFERIKAFVESL